MSLHLGKSAVVVLIGLGAAALVSCVCPPCVPPGGQAEVAKGAKMIIWDGDGGGLPGGKGWASCDEKAACKSKVSSEKGVGRDGSTGLKWHSEGPAWRGFGWNLFGWWPQDAGIDLSGYKDLAMWVKIEADSPDLAPPLDSIVIALGCSKGQKTSANASASKYEKNLLDGKWHKLTIPISQFKKGKEGREFDLGTTWELRFSAWAPSSRNFNLYLDDVYVENP